MTTVENRTKGAQLDAAETALRDAEQVHGLEALELAPLIERAADLYSRDGLCAKAEILYRRLVDILCRAKLQPAFVDALGKLASNYRCEGKFDQAESVYLQALAVLGDGPEAKRQTAEHLCCLAGVYLQKAEFSQAEDALTKASHLFHDALGGQSNYSRLCHIALATIGLKQGKTGEANEQFLLSQKVGGEAGDASTDQRSLVELAQDYYKQVRLTEVELLLAQTIYSTEHRLWPGHPLVGQAMHDRGELFRAQGKFAEAEKAFKQAFIIRSESLGQAHPEVAHTAMSMAGMYMAQGRFLDAEPVLKQAMKTRVLAFGVEHSSVAAAIETYVTVLKNTKRQGIALQLEARARDIRTKLVWHSERASASGRPPA